MKHCIYGIPVISIFVAVMISIALAFLSLILSRHPWISKPLCLLGEASMIIMILHIPARDVIAGRINLGGSIITAIIVGIVLPVLMYLLLNRGKISRRYFLGK